MTKCRRSATELILMSVAISFLLGYALSARAAFPGVNGRIVFTSSRDGNSEIYVMNADGTGQTRLTNNVAEDLDPAWSPDGTKIVFDSNRDGNNEVYVMNADGTGQINLTSNPAQDRDPAWSPDGTKIVFWSPNRDGDSEIYTMNADGTGQTRLTNSPGLDVRPDWSPDGTQIAFRSDRDGNAELYKMNADSTGQTRLTNNAVVEDWPNWSPDGTQIVMQSNRDGNAEIYVVNADGSAPTRLTNNAASESRPVFSPDGAQVAFWSNRDGGDLEVYSMNSDGSSQARITTNALLDYGPDWQPLLSPIAGNDSEVTTTGGPATIDVLDNDTDTYDALDTSTVSVTTAPANGSTSVNATTGVITYTPDTDFIGNDSFTYEVCSSYSDLCDTATVSITVDPVIPGLPRTGNSHSDTTQKTLILSVTALLSMWLGRRTYRAALLSNRG